MTPDLSGKIARQLREGRSKSRIWHDLKGSENRAELLFHLNDLPTAEKQRIFYPATLLLAAILLIMTGIKVFDAIAIGRPNLYFFLALIVPIINIYVLKKILRFRRTGFLYLLVLSILALFQPQNHRVPEAGLLVIMLFLSGFLYGRMFPKEDLLGPAE